MELEDRDANRMTEQLIIRHKSLNAEEMDEMLCDIFQETTR
jgi:hypothetical protein